MVQQKTYITSKAKLAYAAANCLGEGPVWHAARQSLFWVDIEGGKLQELAWPSLAVQSWTMPQRVGMIVPCETNYLVVALQGGLALFNLQTGELDWLVDIE